MEERHTRDAVPAAGLHQRDPAPRGKTTGSSDYSAELTSSDGAPGMSRPALGFRLHCEHLESRENPTNLLTENFDGVRAPNPVFNWQTWGNALFSTSRLNPVTGLNSLALDGSANTNTRTWSNTAQPVDAEVSVHLLSDSPAPLVIFGRGQNLAQPTGSFVGARISASGTRVELVSFANGIIATLATLSVENPGTGVWYDVTLKPVGTTLSVVIQRTDDGRYLSPQGRWLSTPNQALSAQVPTVTGTGFVGLGRTAGGNGFSFFDNFHVDARPIATPLPTEPTDTAKQGTTQNFDTTPVNSKPADWTTYTNDRSVGFATTTARKNSGIHGYQTTGTSTTTARSYITQAQPANVQASANLYVDSLVPATIFVRGSAVDSASPNYYGLSVVRGLEANIVAVVDGKETVLGTVRSKTYVSSVWLRLNLTADGDKLRAVISRQDTGQWLSTDGTWSDLPQPALEVTDKKLTTAGNVGLARPAKFAGAVTFDDVSIQLVVAGSGPQVTVTQSQPNFQYQGEVTFSAAQATGSTPIRYVEFRLNGKVRSSQFSAPASWTLDTTLITNGKHELVVRALDDNGNVASKVFSFTTNNAVAAPVRAPLARKQSHIRIAQLAYSATPFDSFEQARIADSVDLVIPNTKFNQAIETSSASTPQLLYSNVSNLYGTLLSDWLSYADRTSANREAAFYHVTKATAWQGASPSSQPVNQFWGVTRTTGTTVTELAAAARGGRSFGVDFAGAGSTVDVGYPEKFFELNFDLTKTASGNWRGVYEYPTAVDAQGKPTAWKALTLTADSTAQLTKSGRVNFNVPSDWVAADVGTGSRLFTVRIRTSAGTLAEAPASKTILGRDYAGANGTNKGIIPTFDANADRDGDGFLNDAEYAARAAGKDARFVYESRLFYPFYGQQRFVTNPSSTVVRRWAVEYHQNLLRANPLVDGFFLDNSNGRLPFGDTVLEATSAYGNDYADLTAAVRRSAAPKLVFTNTAGGQSDADPVAAVSSGVFEEFLLRPTEANWASFADVSNLVKSRIAADAPSPYVILDSHPGSFKVTDERVKTGTLAYYYLVSDPEYTMLMFFGGNNPSANWEDTWIASSQVDVGKPTAATRTFATGNDPQNNALEYRVMSREFEKALVLYKPRSYKQAVGTGTTDDATATTHELGGNYRVLNANGTLGPVVNRITLRNGEGVTLMKA